MVSRGLGRGPGKGGGEGGNATFPFPAAVFPAGPLTHRLRDNWTLWNWVNAGQDANRMRCRRIAEAFEHAQPGPLPPFPSCPPSQDPPLPSPPLLTAPLF